LSSAEAAAADEPPGQSLLAEIRDQPRALEALLEHAPEYARTAAAIASRGAKTIRIVGHGSSDNAAAYGMYAFGLLPCWTAFRDSITLSVYYDASVAMGGSTVLAMSQSGRTPDVVEYVARARRNGALTVAITNDVSSELATQAEFVLPLAAGPELSIAATKTYVNQLAALALLAAHAADRGRDFVDALRRVAGHIGESLPEFEARIRPIALTFAFVGRMFVIGRGPEFATAREISLKLLETCRVAAEPLTATDLAHGPVAALDAQFPVWAIASADATLPTVVEAAARIRETGATLVASGNAAAELAYADYVLPTRAEVSPLLAPLLSVIPGQLFAWSLAHAKGLDPDRPERLSKVTLAQ
jgi:glucosamine--fructose-6-phosphate aminotransferase (isomerizing)